MTVTGGEHYYTAAQMRAYLEAWALDMVILDFARVAGRTPWRKLTAMGEAYNISVYGHVVSEVHMHLLAPVPAGHMVRYMPLSTEVLANMPVPVAGKMAPLDAPGHGLRLDESAVARFNI